MRRLLLAASRTHPASSFRFDKENSWRPDDHVIDIPIFPAGKIMEGPVAAVGNFLQCLRNGLFAAQPKPNILAPSNISCNQDCQICPADTKYQTHQSKCNEPKAGDFDGDLDARCGETAQAAGEQKFRHGLVNQFIQLD